MTRETRVGLVVGLMFIIMFGVVLSELGSVDKSPDPENDVLAGKFFAGAPVVPAPRLQPRQEVPLVAASPAGAQGRAVVRGAQQPQPQPRRRPARPVVVTPRRAVPQRPAPQRPVIRAAEQTRTPRRSDPREMTMDEFARTRGVGASPQNSRTYVTCRGDNLTAIARKFYRTPSRQAVMKIFNANSSVLRSPDSVGVGVKLVIPN